MVTAWYDQSKSDKWIKQLMAKHRGAGGDINRDLLRQKLDNGYDDNAEGHEIYWLQGSPIKAYAVRVKTRISFYEQNGKRWAIYGINGNPKIKHEISKKNSEILRGEGL